MVGLGLKLKFKLVVIQYSHKVFFFFDLYFINTVTLTDNIMYKKKFLF
jgi:hypothetical protein